MSSTRKTVLFILGTLAAILIFGQLLMGRIILSHPDDVHRWVKLHEHSGYLTVVVTLAYIVTSLVAIALTRPPRSE
jgi:hypothetical protein